jgi:hypothetical protein
MSDRQEAVPPPDRPQPSVPDTARSSVLPAASSAVIEMHNDSRRLRQNKLAVLKSRNSAIRVDLTILGRFLSLLGAVHETKMVIYPDLFEAHMRSRVCIRWIIMELIHDLVSVQLSYLGNDRYTVALL